MEKIRKIFYTKLNLVWFFTVIALGIILIGGCLSSDSSDESGASDCTDDCPIVFVHGQSGSAQQFETQAMRFTSNSYSKDMLFVFEYDTSQSTNPLADLDLFLDGVLAETGANQVFAIGHSRGTSVWTSYLDDPSFDGPSKVAKYVNIDGRSPEALPGGIPTIGIWGEWNTAGSGYTRDDKTTDTQIGPNAEDNYHFGTKSHSEVATSAEAFAVMYEFLTGVAPTTTDVVSETNVTVSGRVVFFPENRGYKGATLDVWRIEPSSGQRIGDDSQATFTIGETGDFGPVELNSLYHYEFALLRPPNDDVLVETVHHFYPEPFSRSNHLFRLQSSEPAGSIEAYLPAEEDYTGMLVQRQREFWGDQDASSDELSINGLNVLNSDTSPRTGVNLAVFVFDESSDGATDLSKGEVFPFNYLTFLTGVDVSIPASSTASGTVSVDLVTRGGSETQLNVPNWPSATDRISVMFNDDTQ